MNLACGIVGLANVGKSTLFNALLKKQVAQAANYPFTTIEPNIGIVEVPDARLEKLKGVVEKSEGLSPSFKIISATVRFVDIAGLVRGAHKGEGLGNQFLAHIREVDAIVFVLRDFSDENVIKTGENPTDDLEVLKSELLLKDLETLEKRIDSLGREIKAISGSDPRKAVLAAIEKAKAEVEKGRWLAETLLSEELDKISDLQLLSAKKTITVVNCDEGDLTKEPPIAGAIRICAKLEEELAGLTEIEKKQYLSELNLKELGLEKLIKKAYETLGLATFLTAGAKEVRAWTIKRGTLAPAAAGVVHSDFERGFIAADIVPYEKFVNLGGWIASRQAGGVKTIGKNEILPEDVIVEFKFNV